MAGVVNPAPNVTVNWVAEGAVQGVQVRSAVVLPSAEVYCGETQSVFEIHTVAGLAS